MNLSKSSWNEILMNFIIKLLKLRNFIIKENYNVILVIINWLTKYAYIILFKKLYIIKKIKYVILN